MNWKRLGSIAIGTAIMFIFGPLPGFIVWLVLDVILMLIFPKEAVYADVSASDSTEVENKPKATSLGDKFLITLGFVGIMGFFMMLVYSVVKAF